jgi:hypothetical protein
LNYFLAFLLLMLSSCAETKFSASPTQLPVANAPEAAPLNLQPFSWKIYNESDLRQLIANLPPGSHVVLYTLDGDNYAAFDADLNELQRYIQEQHEVIEFYRKLENSNNKVSK